MNLIYNMIVAFSMYSKIPMPHVEWTKERMRYMFCFFPVIGAVIGAALYLWMRFGGILVGDDALFTAVLVLIPIIITGGIHLDGFLDTCDALSSYKSMEEKLEILKDSHAGAFAIIMGCCYFLVSYGVYHAMTMDALKLTGVGFVLSRALSGFAVVKFKKAKKSGLVYAFSDSSQKQTVAVTMIAFAAVSLVLMLLIDPVPGICCFAFALIWFFCYRGIAYKKFGGTTGDIAGFFSQLCELGIALTAVTVYHIMG